jgi:hypothetical protein
MTWDRGLYYPSKGRCAEDFFTLKNPTALAGFEPVNLGTKGQHATPRPPKLLISFGFRLFPKICFLFWYQDKVLEHEDDGDFCQLS